MSDGASTGGLSASTRSLQLTAAPACPLGTALHFLGCGYTQVQVKIFLQRCIPGTMASAFQDLPPVPTLCLEDPSSCSPAGPREAHVLRPGPGLPGTPPSVCLSLCLSRCLSICIADLLISRSPESPLIPMEPCRVAKAALPSFLWREGAVVESHAPTYPWRLALFSFMS